MSNLKAKNEKQTFAKMWKQSFIFWIVWIVIDSENIWFEKIMKLLTALPAISLPEKAN